MTTPDHERIPAAAARAARVALRLLLMAAVALAATPDTLRAAPAPRPQTAPRAAASPKAPPIRQARLNGRTYLLMADVARFYGLAASRRGKAFVFSSPYTRLELTPDARTATLSGIDVVLAFAPMLHQKSLYLSQADFTAFIDPVLRPSTLPRRTVRRIVIDAGHGGKDPGCKGSGTIEKDVNLAIALKLATTLHRRGYTVAMTRMSDLYLTLAQRVALAQRFRPDLFISLHCNAAGAAVSGIEVYAATPKDTPASDAKTISAKACAATPHDRTNAFVAYHTQRQLVSALKLPDRASRRKRYTVIADLNAPAILVEMGFLTNATDRATLRTPARQTLVANAIANAVDLYRKAVAPRPAR
ncbi:MAG: N-acetylmuramoyl-L-alanine amidase [Oligosphaeraceae bacterium]